jgi:hypothetical protein
MRPIVLSLACLLLAGTARAQDPLKDERCLRRMSALIAGMQPGYGIPQPTSDVPAYADVLLATSQFQKRFAGWIDYQFNRTPSQRSDQNAAYYLALYVLQNGLQWKQMFVGQWDIVPINANGDYPKVVANPDGLGYFRTDAWMRRYAGNEPDGYRLTAAYRMMQNVIGLKLVASANNAVGDFTATGRERPECRGCHYDSAFALDKVARVLPRRIGTGKDLTFGPPTDGPQVIFNGVTVANDADVVNAMVNSDHFRFNVCRLAFEYLYNRPENACEAPIFDRCMAAFGADGMIQTAIATLAKDPSFCE